MFIPTALQDAYRRLIEIYEAGQRELAAERADPRSASKREQDSTLDAIRDRTAAAIRQLVAEVDRTEGQLRDEIGQVLRHDSQPSEDAKTFAYAAIVKPLLDQGRALDEIIGAVKGNRAAIAALRDAVPAVMVATGAAPGSLDFDGRVSALRRTLDDVELPLLDARFRDAHETDRRREQLVAAFEASAKHVVAGRSGGRALIELGYDQATALGQRAHEPGQREWTEMTDEIGALNAAERQRNSLSGDLRAALDGHGARPDADPSMLSRSR